MKVRCSKIVDSLGSPQATSTWLTIGKIYDVLTIELSRQGGWWIRLIGDGAYCVALFPLEDFEVVSASISPSWIASWDSSYFQLTYRKWVQPDFWENYYDREPAALEIFDEGVAELTQNSETTRFGA